jgi:hypothetical protein
MSARCNAYNSLTHFSPNRALKIQENALSRPEERDPLGWAWPKAFLSLVAQFED